MTASLPEAAGPVSDIFYSAPLRRAGFLETEDGRAELARFTIRLERYGGRGRDANGKRLKILAVAYACWYELESNHIPSLVPPIDNDLELLAIRRLKMQHNLRRQLGREPRDAETAAAVANGYFSGNPVVKTACKSVERLAKQACRFRFGSEHPDIRPGVATHKHMPTYYIGGYPHRDGVKTEPASVENARRDSRAQLLKSHDAADALATLTRRRASEDSPWRGYRTEVYSSKLLAQFTAAEIHYLVSEEWAPHLWQTGRSGG